MRLLGTSASELIREERQGEPMTDVNSTVTLEDIGEILQQIEERLQPQKVILFGSYAYSQSHEGSDLDLLIVTPHPPSHEEGWKAAWELSEHSPAPPQLIFMSTEEFEETQDVVGGIAYPAHHWGKVLHDANP